MQMSERLNPQIRPQASSGDFSLGGAMGDPFRPFSIFWQQASVTFIIRKATEPTEENK